MSENFTIEIISPEKSIIKSSTTEVVIPSYEGEMGILKDHVPLITFLRPGIITIINVADKKKFFVEEGTVEFSNNNLLILTSKAKELGMNNTNFKNPDGLDQEGHFTTLSDLLILSKEVVNNYELLSIIMRQSFISNIEGEDKVYLNTNKLIDRNFYGLKTGWTNEAGLTFIGLNQSNDRNLSLIHISEPTRLLSI